MNELESLARERQGPIANSRDSLQRKFDILQKQYGMLFDAFVTCRRRVLIFEAYVSLSDCMRITKAQAITISRGEKVAKNTFNKVGERAE